MNIKPTGNRVLIKPVEKKETSAGGIFIPQSARDDKSAPYEATVIAVGPGKRTPEGFVKADISVGDLVIAPSYQGSEVTLNGAKHYVLDADLLLGVVEEA
jgi:chaperonin GroES